MCILIIKPKNEVFPSEGILRNCFESNPDGIGLAWMDESGKSHIRKGFFKFKKFMKHVGKLADELIPYDVIIHFRLATHGSISIGNCHPFPIDTDINRLKKGYFDGYFPIMAHNGVIHQLGNKAKKTINDLSDTMVFAKELRLKGEKDKDNQKILNMGKFAILDMDGLRTYGNFIEDNGILYSNESYMSFDERWPIFTSKYKYKDDNDLFIISDKIDDYIHPDDIGSDGWCLNERVCRYDGYCCISGMEFEDILHKDSYRSICPILMNKRDLKYDPWGDLYV